MTAQVVLPGVLAELCGSSTLEVEAGTLRSVLDALHEQHPVLVRRIRDETGALRRYVNVYVDGDDVRFGDRLDTAVADGATVQVLPSVAGGA